MDQLLDELLTFSRLDAGQYPLEKQQLDLTELLSAIIELNQLEADAKQQQVQLNAPEQCWLAADQRLLGRAIENVLRNAIKYSPAESLILCTLKQHEQQLELLIQDQGPGVPEESLSQIFAPFYRVSTVREHQNGTGLGLAIAASAIRQHQGSIECFIASNRWFINTYFVTPVPLRISDCLHHHIKPLNASFTEQQLVQAQPELQKFWQQGLHQSFLSFDQTQICYS